MCCCICLNYYIQPIYFQPCCHTFCKACIVRWLLKSEVCPLCKTKYLDMVPIDPIIWHTRHVVLQPPSTGTQIGMTICRYKCGMFISSVIQDLPAWVVGLRHGHIITHINELPCIRDTAMIMSHLYNCMQHRKTLRIRFLFIPIKLRSSMLEIV